MHVDPAQEQFQAFAQWAAADPSRSAFLEMVADPAYLETSRIPTAALADSRLPPCTETVLGV
jgi:hypothetical protein